MITRIILENFMAHELTELELGPGVNALTGPNNAGKSAIVEALRCVATNPMPKYYIRHGAKEARVTVEVEDGTRVVWIRKKGSSGYEVWPPGAEEPEEYWKFGRKPPEDVLSVLRLNLVELEGNRNDIDVHVGNQRDPVFLLNQPKSDAASFFAASTESVHLLAMQDRLKRKTQDAKRREKDLTGRMEGVEEQLDMFEPLPSIGLTLESARELEGTARDFQKTIPALEQALAEQAGLASKLRDQNAMVDALATLRSAPVIEVPADLSAVYHQIIDMENDLVRIERQAASLSPLKSMPATEDTRQLAGFSNELRSLEKALGTAEGRNAAMGSLAPPPEPYDVSQISWIIDELLADDIRVRREQRRRDALLGLEAPPELAGLDHLQSLLAEVVDLNSQAGAASRALHQLEMELEMLQKDIGKRLDELGRCPTCGAELDMVEFLDRGCRHGS